MRSRFLLAFALTASLAQAQSLNPTEIKGLLARIREHRASAPDVHASFQEQKTIHLMNKPVVSSGKIWFHAPNKFRRRSEERRVGKERTSMSETNQSKD